jgi:endonuclease G
MTGRTSGHQQPPAAAPGDVDVPAGYDRDFLGDRIELPVLDASIRDDVAPTVDGGTVVRHTHFSLQMSRVRRFAFWVAWNIDGGALAALSRTGLRFVRDPQVAPDVQVGDELYGDNLLDRGHVARRADLIWGGLREARQANADSFYFTNITPQMEDFNRSSRHGVWGRLEDAVFADAEVADLRVSAFGGPVFRNDDRVVRGVALPREYWKVLAFRDGGALKARAFVLTQDVGQAGLLELDEFRVFQLTLPDLAARTGVRFPDLRDADGPVVPELLAQQGPLESTEDIRW